MAICAFFGHRDAPMSNRLEERLEAVVRELITQNGVDHFWSCEQGTFDRLSRLVVKKFIKEFNLVFIHIVTAYFPSEAVQRWMDEQDYDLIYPEELVRVPKRAAIVRRNEYMVQNADFIVCYIDHDYGGAYEAVQKAKKYGKKIINLADEKY